MRDYKDYKPRKSVTKKSSGKRLPPRFFKIAAVLIVLVVLMFAARYAYRRFLTTSYFSLREIVVTGEKRARRDEIINLSGARTGGNVLAMDLKRVAERIESQPWIESASVRRALPGGLSIDVKEREPFAILKTGRLFYLDRGGKPIKELDNSDDAGYPVITGFSREEIERDESARDAVMKCFEFIESEAGSWPKNLAISEIVVNRNQGITALLDNLEVKLGFGEYNIKVGRLKRVLDDLKAKDRTARYIDLTYTGQVVVR